MQRTSDTHDETRQPNPVTELLNENQVAQRLGVSIATVRRWRAKRTGPAFRKIGGTSVRYSADELKLWVQTQPTGGEKS